MSVINQRPDFSAPPQCNCSLKFVSLTHPDPFFSVLFFLCVFFFSSSFLFSLCQPEKSVCSAFRHKLGSPMKSHSFRTQLFHPPSCFNFIKPICPLPCCCKTPIMFATLKDRGNIRAQHRFHLSCHIPNPATSQGCLRSKALPWALSPSAKGASGTKIPAQ